MFGNQERETLSRGGRRLGPDSIRKYAMERFLAYVALTRSSDYLFVSSAAGSDGPTGGPSSVFRMLRDEVFPDLAQGFARALHSTDYRTPRGLRKTQVLELAQNRWIAAHQSTLITGPSGAGKSYLAQAFGLNACRNGFTVQYVRLPTLLAQFVQARAQGTYDRLLRRLAKTALLVIDDFGLAVLSEVEKQDLLEAIEERYGVGATLVTSQLPIGDWHEYLGGGRLADAILDRLVHNAHRIELASKESMRKERAALKHGGHSDK
jgi:DNA replication protein DnaC